MTLVEVIAGLILLGAVVGTMLLARGRLFSKSLEAERKAAAVRVLDSLVSEWWSKPDAFPRAAQGQRDGWTWQTTSIPSPSATTLGSEIIRVELSDPRGPGAALDILIPLAPKKGAFRAAAE